MLALHLESDESRLATKRTSRHHYSMWSDATAMWFEQFGDLSYYPQSSPVVAHFLMRLAVVFDIPLSVAAFLTL